MADPTIDDLADVLREHARDTKVPQAPIDALLSRGRDNARSRSRRMVFAATALVAAVAITAVVVAGRDDRPGTAPPVPPAHSPSATTSQAPATLDGLPVGAAPSVTYVQGTTLHPAAGPAIDLGFEPSGFSRLGDRAVAWDGKGRIVAVDLTVNGSSAIRELDADGATTAVTDGTWAAWTPDVPGQMAVRVQHLTAPYETYDRNITLAGIGPPQCCDDPYYVAGFTEDSVLVISRPSYSKVWMWRVGSHFDNSPPTDRPAVPMKDFPEYASILAVHGYQLVVRLNGGGVQIGSVVASWAPTNTIPGASTVFLGDAFEAGAVRDVPEDESLQVIPALVPGSREQPAGVRLQLPDGIVAEAASWEDERNVVLLVTADASAPFRLVRCEVEHGTCELAGEPDGPVLLTR